MQISKRMALHDVLPAHWCTMFKDEPDILGLDARSHCGQEIKALTAACDVLTSYMGGEREQIAVVQQATCEVAAIILFG
jgi:hypothetical protein